MNTVRICSPHLSHLFQPTHCLTP
uniref:Uncharacterized protein n=1 Tax=Anguilla anguilla TaxID=7936 RepID=A0A0E9Q4L7_ANGAN